MLTIYRIEDKTHKNNQQYKIKVYQLDNSVTKKDTILAFPSILEEEEDKNTDFFNTAN